MRGGCNHRRGNLSVFSKKHSPGSQPGDGFLTFLSMKPTSIFFTLAVIFILFSPAYAQVHIEKTDIAGVDKLINDTDGVSLIVIMASWCAPCRKELPELVKLYDKYKVQGLKMIGISIDDEGPSAMMPLLEKCKVNFPVYWVGEVILEAYHLKGIPAIFLIKNGKMIWRITGVMSGNSLDEKVAAMLMSK